MNGKIIKGIAGFYYVHTSRGLFECKAKGVFRKEKIKPLVGDNVKIEVVDEDKLLGNIVEIFPRSNSLTRPASANIDQALVIFSIVKPEPNYNLLDRFLISMHQQHIATIICFNKKDLVSTEEQQALEEIYCHSGCELLFVSGKKQEGMDRLRDMLNGKTTVVAGPSGVGKSTIVNVLIPEANMKTGEISRKIERGRHTTRHAELFAVEASTYIMDTPGFTSLWVDEMEKEELQSFYPEFEQYEPFCQFGGCVHINEPVCGVRNALSEGKISRIRYENYCLIYEELKAQKKY